MLGVVVSGSTPPLGAVLNRAGQSKVASFLFRQAGFPHTLWGWRVTVPSSKICLPIPEPNETY